MRFSVHPRVRNPQCGPSQMPQRDAFIRRFWGVRDPFPQTARNEFQERWEEWVLGLRFP